MIGMNSKAIWKEIDSIFSALISIKNRVAQCMKVKHLRYIHLQCYFLSRKATFRCIFRFCASAGLVLIIGLGGCADPQEKERNYIESGKTHLKDGNLIKAALDFRNALQINPSSTEAL